MKKKDRTRLVEILTQIKEKRGPYAIDHMQHAENCINCFSDLAKEALTILGVKQQ